MLEKGDYSKFTIQGAKVRLFFDIRKYFLKKMPNFFISSCIYAKKAVNLHSKFTNYDNE